MRRNLIVVRAGDKSLHPQWMNEKERNWDIVVSYYGNYPERYEGQYDLLHVFSGSKWEGVADFFFANPGIEANYDYIWLPDDDLFTTSKNIDLFFLLCKQLDLVIAQPALTKNSYYSWEITLQKYNCLARLTNFVEVMAPCFKAESIAIFSKHFGENSSGWGYEWLWNYLCDVNGLNRQAIVDKTPVFHTRPIGVAGHGGAKLNPRIENSELLKKFGIERYLPRVSRTIVDNPAVMARGKALAFEVAAKLVHQRII
jgi:hypothetical protein